VLADQLGKSVGDMYLGAIGPSIAQVLIFIGFILVMSIIRPQSMPPLPKEERSSQGWTLWKDVLLAIVPSLALIFVVLGTIFMGLATPTEAGAMGVVGAMILAMVHGRFNRTMLWDGMVSTMNITVMVIFILIGATVFTLVFQGVDGGKWIEHFFTAVGADDPVTFLIVVNLLIFGLAFFLDFFEIAFIVIPLLAPIAKEMGIDLIWFGILICVNMQTSFMHPPFGFALFYLRGIAPPSIRSSDIYMGAIPWVLLQLLLVGILIFYPEIVTGLLDKPVTSDIQSIEIKLDESEGAQAPKPAPSDDPADYFKRR
jgi:tripartite ATP-independent transporter DctM subunit